MSDAFATDLYQQLTANDSGNLFFSPISIETALAMTYAGAAGKTAAEMARVMHFDQPPAELCATYGKLLTTINDAPVARDRVDASFKPIEHRAYELVIANALWPQKGYALHPAFLKLVQQSFGAGVNEVDYTKDAEQARVTINRWVEDKTKDKIRDLIPQHVLTDLTRLVLTNAIYFKSNWETKFVERLTETKPFSIAVDKSVDVPLMQRTARFSFAENADVQLLEIPYVENALSMTVILPRERNGLAAVEKKLSADNLGQWEKQMTSQLVACTLPKFKFTSAMKLGTVLRQMGMTESFDEKDEKKADFSAMSDEKEFCISEVIHKAFVAVDEDGTEAAAATAVVMRAGSAAMREPKVMVFKADHPFIFLIRHHATGRMLFAGRVVNPKADAA